MKRLLLLTLVVLSGCGYALVGHSNFLDPSIRTIEVPAFVNRTTRVELAYGSTYLSQSSRYLRLGKDIVKATVFDSRGASRSLAIDAQLAKAARQGGQTP